jgi:iron complex outermembrane receptor protein
LFCLLFFVALWSPWPASASDAETTGAIRGVVADADGTPATDARIRIVELRREIRVDDEGRFVVEGLRPGRYHLEGSNPRHASAVLAVDVAAGRTTEIDVALRLSVHHEEVLVSARPGPIRLGEAFLPAEVLSEDELAVRMSMTLGETLDHELGVSSTYFGPGSSRPIIRGLGSDRSRVLEDGIGTSDVSGLSPDHAVSVDPLLAERIEIVRGPATLRFGSGAEGGVVNVLDGRIPESVPEDGFDGRVVVDAGSVADQRSYAAGVTGGSGGWAFHVRGSTRETEDYEIPGDAERFPEEEHGGESSGMLENSFVETDAYSVGVSRIWDDGFFGVAYAGFDTLYGVPGHGHGHEEEHGEEEPPLELFSGEGEERVSIDLEQRRFDAKGAFDLDRSFVRTLNVRAGYSDYEHVELEGAEVGTRFEQDMWEARVEALHRPIGDLRGSFGVQASSMDLEAFGEEAFVRPSTTERFALFAFEELEREAWSFLFGGRYERIETDGSILFELVGEPERLERYDESFDAVSLSLGAKRDLGDEWVATATLSRSTRAPLAEELYSFGEHAATRSFEIGDPTLDEEVSYGLDLGLRKTAGRVTAEVHVFAQRIDDFIYERPVERADVDAELPIFAFTADDAEFVGFEAHADIGLFERGRHRIGLDVGVESVRAERRRDGEPLPFIPPLTTRVGVHYHGDRFWGFVEARRAEEQDRLFCEVGVDPDVCETTTEGFTFLDAAVGVRFAGGPLDLELILRGRNLTDELARNHVSRLKDLAPLPGRDVSLMLRAGF